MEAVGLHRKGEIDLQQIIDHIKTHPGYLDSGAIASFIGVVRGERIRDSDSKVTHLEYEAYSDVALKRMERSGRMSRNIPVLLRLQFTTSSTPCVLVSPASSS